MTRYEFKDVDGVWQMVSDDAGGWVRYSDVEVLLDTIAILRRTVVGRNEEIKSWRDEITRLRRAP